MTFVEEDTALSTAAEKAGAENTPSFGAGGDAAPAGPPVNGPSDALGQAAWLMLHSPAHKHLFLTDLEWLLLPPIALRQFRIFRQDGRPVAFASWAHLNEEAEQRLGVGTKRLRPADWNAGDRLWLIDLVAPFGGHQTMIQELREKVFAGKKMKTLQPAPDGQSVAVVEW